MYIISPEEKKDKMAKMNERLTLVDMPNEVLLKIICATHFNNDMIANYSLVSRQFYDLIRRWKPQIYNNIARDQYLNMTRLLCIDQHTTSSLSFMKTSYKYMQEILSAVSDVRQQELVQDPHAAAVVVGGLLIIAKLDAERSMHLVSPTHASNPVVLVEDTLSYTSPLSVLVTLRLTCIYILKCIRKRFPKIVTQLQRSNGLIPVADFEAERTVLAVEHVAVTEGLASLFLLVKPVGRLHSIDGITFLSDQEHARAHYRLAQRAHMPALRPDLFVLLCDRYGFLQPLNDQSVAVRIPGPLCMSATMQLCAAIWHQIKSNQSRAVKYDLTGLEESDLFILDFADVVAQLDWLRILHCEIVHADSFLRQHIQSVDDVIHRFQTAWKLYKAFEIGGWDAFAEAGQETGFASFREFKDA